MATDSSFIYFYGAYFKRRTLKKKKETTVKIKCAHRFFTALRRMFLKCRIFPVNVPAEDYIMVRNQNTHHFGIQSPKKGGDVGYDLVVSTDFSLPPHGQSSAAFIIPAGVHIKAPEGFWCMIVGRSSAARRGIDVQTAIIDNGYVGELFACCWNMTNKAILVKRGEKIAQAVFMPACTFPMKEVCELPPTERGGTGFGSTGK